MDTRIYQSNINIFNNSLDQLISNIYIKFIISASFHTTHKALSGDCYLMCYLVLLLISLIPHYIQDLNSNLQTFIVLSIAVTYLSYHTAHRAHSSNLATIIHCIIYYCYLSFLLHTTHRARSSNLVTVIHCIIYLC